MHRIILYTCFVFCLTLLSCGKKKVQTPATTGSQPVGKYYKTITPLPYLPAYPGSYWVYVGGANNDTTRITTSSTYVKDAYNDSVTIYDNIKGLTKIKFKADTSFVPVYDGKRLWGYSYHDVVLYNANVIYRGTLCPLISDTLPFWSISIGSHSGTSAYIQKRDTTILVNGKSYYPTVIVYEYDYSNNTSLPKSRLYYTKDIGLVKEEHLNYMDGSVMSERHLVYYFINK